MSSTLAGWYPDPWGEAAVRWFDGGTWTPRLSNHAGWYPDPEGIAPLRWFDGELWTSTVHDPSGHAPTVGTTTTSDGSSPDAAAGASTSAASPDNAGYVVLAVSTSGPLRGDRVVEVAVLTFDRAGCAIAEFATLVNPERNVEGSQWRHGLTSDDLAKAPTFADIASSVAELVEGRVVVAEHPLFTTTMLGREFAGCGVTAQWGPHGDAVVTRGAEWLSPSALDRAWAVVAAPTGPALTGSPVPLKVTEADVALVGRTATTPGSGTPYIAAISAAIPTPPIGVEYVAHLGWALSTFGVTRADVDALLVDFGVDAAQSDWLNTWFVEQLIAAALDGGVVGSREVDELRAAADVLCVSGSVVEASTAMYRFTDVAVGIDAGMSVYFAHESGRDSFGLVVPRSDLVDAAVARDARVVDDVAAGHCDVVVAATRDSTTAQAQTAWSVGIPVVSMADFLCGIDDRVPVPGRLMRPSKVENICIDCHASWTAARHASLCVECRQTRWR